MSILELFLQLLAAAMVVSGIFLAYRWLVGPYEPGLSLQQRGAALLVLLAMVGGFIGAFFWWVDEPRSFAWDLPPLASRMLAAAGWSFAAAGFLALRRATFHRLRLVMLMLFVYLVPLVLAILQQHLDRFDFSAFITYTFFLIAIGMAIASTWYLLQPQTIIENSPADTAPTPPSVQAWLVIVALISGLWGLGLFLTDNGPSALVWAWPGDLLSSQLIGVMLLTISAGSLYSRRSASLARMMLLVTITYSLGLAAASLANALDGRPVKEAYVVVFEIIFLVSAGMLPLLRAPVRDTTRAIR